MICPLRMGMGIHWLLRMRINRLGQGRMGMEIIGIVCIQGVTNFGSPLLVDGKLLPKPELRPSTVT
jgi:hypothetical protein